MNDGSPLALYADELRRARTEAGLSQEALGKLITYSASLVAGVEQGRRNPSPSFTQRCDEVLKTGGRLQRIRWSMMKQALSSWLRDWTPHEQDALVLRWYEPVLVPGLLQTEDYARAVIARGPVPADKVEEQVAVRMERQAILTRKDPVRLTAVIDEFVLRRPIGGPDVMKDQLEHLIGMAQQPHVHLHVVPAEIGYAGSDGGFIIATLPGGQDVGYVDNPLGGQLVELSADVLNLRNIWEDVRAVAMPEGLTISLIEEALKSWS